MDTIVKQVRRAQWWLAVQRFVGVVGWCWFTTLLAAVVLIAVDKFYPLGVCAWAWGAGAIGLGLIVALVWSQVTRRRPLDAAVEIDRRFGLKERISSVLAMSPKERETDVGQTLVADAARRIERIEVAERFPVRPGRQLLLPLLPGIVAVLVALLVPSVSDQKAEAKTDPVAAKKQVQQVTQRLQEKMVKKQQEAKKEGLRDLEHILKKLNEDLNSQGDKADRKDLLVKLNDLAQQLEKREQQLGGPEAMQKHLAQLKNKDRGPADKMTDALSKGNVQEAMRELEKMKNELEKGKLSPEDQKKLAQQLEAMQKKIEEMANAQEKARQDLSKEVERLRQSGNHAQADKLQEQLDKLTSQVPQMNKFRDLAKQLESCSQSLKDGKSQQASDALSQAKEQLEDLKEKLEESNMLSELKEQINQARNQANCDRCGGKGCKACQGQGQEGMSEEMNEGDGEGNPGPGMGKGRGAGRRPEEATKTGFYNAKPPMKTDRGSMTVAGETEGPNAKGKAQEAFFHDAATTKQQAADPLTNTRMPRKYREHAKEYLEQIREGKE